MMKNSQTDRHTPKCWLTDGQHVGLQRNWNTQHPLTNEKTPSKLATIYLTPLRNGRILKRDPSHWIDSFLSDHFEKLPGNVLCHKRTGQFFLGGLSHLCPENFSTAPEKTAMLTCKITLPDSPHSVIVTKNPGFRALYLAQQNEFRFFVMNTKMFFSLFGCWLLIEKVSFCPKNNGFARVWGGGGCSPPASWFVRLWAYIQW